MSIRKFIMRISRRKTKRYFHRKRSMTRIKHDRRYRTKRLIKIYSSHNTPDPLPPWPQVDELLKKGDVDVNGVFAGHTALQAASQNGHLEVIHILLRNNAHVEKEVRIGEPENYCVFLWKCDLPFTVVPEHPQGSSNTDELSAVPFITFFCAEFQISKVMQVNVVQVL